MQESRGYVATIVGGEVVTEHGVPTGALPGPPGARRAGRCDAVRLAAELRGRDGTWHGRC